MQLRYKRSMYDVAVLTSDSQDGPVGRIELEDAQGLVLRPFLEAAVQLELHDPRSPSRPIASFTPCSGAAPHASLRFARRAMAMSLRATTSTTLRRQLAAVSRHCLYHRHRAPPIHPIHMRTDARASTAKNSNTHTTVPSPLCSLCRLRVHADCARLIRNTSRLRAARRNIRTKEKAAIVEPLLPAPKE